MLDPKDVFKNAKRLDHSAMESRHQINSQLTVRKKTVTVVRKRRSSKPGQNKWSQS